MNPQNPHVSVLQDLPTRGEYTSIPLPSPTAVLDSSLRWLDFPGSYTFRGHTWLDIIWLCRGPTCHLHPGLSCSSGNKITTGANVFFTFWSLVPAWRVSWSEDPAKVYTLINPTLTYIYRIVKNGKIMIFCVYFNFLWHFGQHWNVNISPRLAWHKST